METREVVVLTTFSFIVFSVGEYGKDGKLPEAKQLIAWGALFVAFVALADFGSTASLAAAFAWLLALSVFLLYGAEFFAKMLEAIK